MTLSRSSGETLVVRSTKSLKKINKKNVSLLEMQRDVFFQGAPLWGNSHISELQGILFYLETIPSRF